MKYSLRTKLVVSFVATTLTCVFLIGFFSNVQLEKHFKEYVLQNQIKENTEIVEMITSGGLRQERWDVAVIEEIGKYALKQGLIIQVRDDKGKDVWNSYMTLGEDSKNTMEALVQRLKDQVENNRGKSYKQTYPIMKGKTLMGTVDMTFYDAVSFDEIDLHFVKTLNWVFILVGVFSFVMSLLLGVILSNRISKPITRVIKKAQLIADGTYEELSIEKSSTREISQLTTTINELAVTLGQQEKLRKRLTGDIAHELRTPLTTLHSHMEAMIDGVWEATEERLISCDEEIMRIIRLVSDLEKLASYESDNLTLNHSYFSANELLEQVFKSFEAEFSKLGVHTSIECEEIQLYGDRDKLNQVFINLISNALKFTPKDGWIKIIGVKSAKGIDVTVSDNGQGIPSQDLPHIFERFYRADVSRNRMTGGAGIGLALVKAIVEAHGGTVAVTSEVEKGTSFVIHFPNQHDY